MRRPIYRNAGNSLVGVFDPVKSPLAENVEPLVTDGDTLKVVAQTYFNIRFLGVDTPEKSYKLPRTKQTFRPIDDPVFASLLADPLGTTYGSLDGLTPALDAYLTDKASPAAADNQMRHAEAATQGLADAVQNDADQLGTESFFLNFAYEAIDGFGRLLAYVSPNQPIAPPGGRASSYNERQLAAGLAFPYFIFPNVDPFRTERSPLIAARNAVSPSAILDSAPNLRRARNAAAVARRQGLGVFDPHDPCVFEPFEVRYIADRRPPSRWVIDLGKDDSLIRQPTSYHLIPNPEDRLWVPAEFVPLFEKYGWRLESRA